MSEKNHQENIDQHLDSMDRRRFMELTAKFGFTAAAIAMTTGIVGSREAHAEKVSNEEKERKAAAKHTMNLATAYIMGASRTYPIMQLDMKENIQNFTNGQVYVKLAPAGQLGAGSALVQKVQSGTIQAAEHSLANFAPFASAADLINIPYWCGENQKFVNLVTSDAWKNELNPKIEAKGFKALWYVVIDPRVVALRKGVKGPVKTPKQMEGLKFRVPGSKILQQFYQLLGANPTPIAWGETSSAIKQGVADALDPSVEALLIFGFKEVLSSITFNGRYRIPRSIPATLNGSTVCPWISGMVSTMPARSPCARIWPRSLRPGLMPWRNWARSGLNSMSPRPKKNSNGSMRPVPSSRPGTTLKRS
ncbi:MAG: TRAP transporter substrate-binding protein [Desulfotignum sp.]|nr:TRAP transporter substrate-binding protein [Desulfotignum sp.]